MGSATPASTTPVAAPRLWTRSPSSMFTSLLDHGRNGGDTAGDPQRGTGCSFCRCDWLLTKLPLFSRLKGAVAGWISTLIDPNGCTMERRERHFEQLRSKLHEPDSIGAGNLSNGCLPPNHAGGLMVVFLFASEACTVEPRVQYDGILPYSYQYGLLQFA